MWYGDIYLVFSCFLSSYLYWEFNVCLWSILLDSIEDIAGKMCSLWIKWNEVRKRKKTQSSWELNYPSSVLMSSSMTQSCLCVGLKIHNTGTLTVLYYLKCLETFRKFQFWNLFWHRSFPKTLNLLPSSWHFNQEKIICIKLFSFEINFEIYNKWRFIVQFWNNIL